MLPPIGIKLFEELIGICDLTNKLGSSIFNLEGPVFIRIRLQLHRQISHPRKFIPLHCESWRLRCVGDDNRNLAGMTHIKENSCGKMYCDRQLWRLQGVLSH